MNCKPSTYRRREFLQWTAGATAAIFWSPGHTHAAQNLAYRNPVFAGEMPDPGVLRFGGRYYAFGTTGNRRLGDGQIFRLLISDDLVNWQDAGGALQPPFDNTDIQYWAPEVVHHQGTFYLYYSAGTLPDLRFEIRVATSQRPEGPYRDTGEPLQEGENAPFFIDGHAFQDDDGQWYFFYAKDFLDAEDGYHARTGIVVDRLLEMTRLEGKPQMVVRPRYAWTLFQANRKMDSYGGRVFDWHTIEAPWIVKKNGKYYCFYSGSNYGTENYGLDYVVADTVMGPYRNQGRYARVLRGVPNLVRGPGHPSIVQAPDDKTEMVVYHAWNEAMTQRQMWVDPLVWTTLGPRCVGPTLRRKRITVGAEQ